MKKLVLITALGMCFAGNTYAQAKAPNPSSAWTPTERAEVEKCAKDVGDIFRGADKEYKAVAATKLTAPDRLRFQIAYHDAFDKWAKTDWAKPYKEIMPVCKSFFAPFQKVQDDLKAMIAQADPNSSKTADQQLKDCFTDYASAREGLVKKYEEYFQHLSTRPKTQKKFSELKNDWPVWKQDNSIKACQDSIALVKKSDLAMLSYMRNSPDLDK